VVLSPKIAEHVILKKWELRNGYHCDELRWVRHEGQSIPNTQIKAKEYYISPHSDGLELNEKNINHCIKLCMENPTWKLSLQQHKTWKIR
jgi:organic radical activating enzyme